MIPLPQRIDMMLRKEAGFSENMYVAGTEQYFEDRAQYVERHP